MVYLFIRYASIGAIIGGYGTETHLVFNVIILARNFILYVARLFIPPLPSKEIVIITYFLFGLLTLVMALALTISGNLKAVWKKFDDTNKFLFFVTASFMISILPMISFGISAVDTQGERMLYLPSVFFSIGIIVFLHSLIRNQIYFRVILIALFIFYGVQLHITNKNWILAGKTSKSIVHSLKSIGNVNQLFILNLPDNIKGAYIFRHCLFQAARLFLNTSTIKNITVISLHTIHSPKETIAVTGNINQYSIRLLSPGELWMNREMTSSINQKNKTFTVIYNKPNGYDLTIQHCDKQNQFAYYSGGKLSPVYPNSL